MADFAVSTGKSTVSESSSQNMDEDQRESSPSDFMSDAICPAAITSWVLHEYHLRYCNAGKPARPLDMDDFHRHLQAQRPASFEDVVKFRAELDMAISTEICKEFAVDENGRFQDQVGVMVSMCQLRPDLAQKMVVAEVIDLIEKEGLCSGQQAQAAETSTLLRAPAMLLEASQPEVTAETSTSPNIFNKTLKSVEAWVREEFGRHYCDKAGSLIKTPNFVALRVMLNRERFADTLEIAKAVEGLESELASKPLSAKDAAQIYMMAQTECDKYTWTVTNRPALRNTVVVALLHKRPDIHIIKIEEAVKKAEMSKQARTPQLSALTVSHNAGASVPKSQVQPKQPSQVVLLKGDGFDLATERGMKAWVYLQYARVGFAPNGLFKGYPQLEEHLKNLKMLRPGLEGRAIEAMRAIRRGRTRGFSFDVERDGQSIRTKGLDSFCQQAESATRTFRAAKDQAKHPASNGTNLTSSTGSQPAPLDHIHSAAVQQPSAQSLQPMVLTSRAVIPKDDLPTRKLTQLQNDSKRSHEAGDDDVTLYGMADATKTLDCDPFNLTAMDLLLSDDSNRIEEDHGTEAIEAQDSEVRQAPLITTNILIEDHGAGLPQYGLLGSYEKEKVFLNTNVPFSAFICGVQGSGKSHTTSCILENALIPSPQLGRLQKPLSALVFRYGPFSGEGSGYSISEAAFLAAPNSALPHHPRVRTIRVLVPPSNYVKLSRLYVRVPNVTVTPFKLKPTNLDIEVMLTLMNVSETAETPLYMAAVTQLLRQMATEGSSFNYLAFKYRLKTCRFNLMQRNMLQIRLGLLESFLDLANSCPEPQFAEGEITIIDLSCPFVDPNTACILFRIGLQKYLQSPVAGKMIVVDEAHKYMLQNPGARALNEALRTVIRMQRHYGARVVISTQEPTLLTDLIALCSVTVIHRFSSPEWFAAIKRHIQMQSNEFGMVMEAIEGLKTGTALVYCPNAALGRDEVGNLVKGVGKLLKLNIRKRVTSDGGQSVLAV